jgi:2-dehydropantoate 2-reductase
LVASWLNVAARHEIVLCARRPLAELTLIWGERRFSFAPQVWTQPADASPVDWVLITTKAYDVAGAAAWLPYLLRESTPVAVLQNGVEHRERFAAFVDPKLIVPVMVDCPAERATPREIRQRGPAKMIVGDDELGRVFAELFGGTEISVTLSSDMKSALWRKLCLNCAGVVSALLLKPAGVMRDERVGELARSLVRECIAVGRAEGADLEDSLADTVLAGYRAAPPDAVNSLHADRAAGRPMESDARNGVIVRLGRKHGIATPYNAMALTLLEAAAIT